MVKTDGQVMQLCHTSLIAVVFKMTVPKTGCLLLLDVCCLDSSPRFSGGRERDAREGGEERNQGCASGEYKDKLAICEMNTKCRREGRGHWGTGQDNTWQTGGKKTQTQEVLKQKKKWVHQIKTGNTSETNPLTMTLNVSKGAMWLVGG